MDRELGERYNLDYGQQASTTNANSVLPKENNFKKIDQTIFEYFTILAKSEDDNKRLLTINQLLQYVKHIKPEEEKHEVEVLYCLKRLIRGCGAANNKSRCSFYVALVAFLKIYDNCTYINLSDCFRVLDKELHVGNTLNKKEDADAVVGHILVCSALLRSGFLFKKLEGNKNKPLEQLVQRLVKSTKHRLYHSGLAYQLLCELLDYLTEQQFVDIIWPHLQILLEQPWREHTTNSVYCLLKIKEKFPQILTKQYLRCHYGGSTLLNKDSYASLYKIFWQHSNMDILIQPALHEFGKYLANAKHLCEFWSKEIDKALEKPNKLTELLTLKILTDILENIDIQHQKLHISKLLSDKFMIMLVNGLKNLKQTQKDYDMINAFYHDFLQALVEYCQRLGDDNEKVEIIKRLILPPQGTLGIEKLCHQRIIHQLVNTLEADGIKNIFELYKSIYMVERIKNPNNCEEKWLNFERVNAGYMLQRLLQSKAIQSSYKWREKQLKFLFMCGMIYVTDKGEPCQKGSSGQFSKDFSDQCKNMFYNCLQGKISNLEKEYKLLWNLFCYCYDFILRGSCLNNDNVSDNDKCVHFKTKPTALKEIQATFKNIKELLSTQNINKMEKKKNGANDEDEYKYDGVMIVFKILITYMSLQVFRESEMAVPVILDLTKCMERLHNKPMQPVIIHDGNYQKDMKEPEWIEVVIDLFLHLLSQNSNCLRTVINVLFPHLCPNLSLTTVHQILNVLNMKDNYNPLTANTELNVEYAENEEDEDENDDFDTEEEKEEINNSSAESDIDADYHKAVDKGNNGDYGDDDDDNDDDGDDDDDNDDDGDDDEDDDDDDDDVGDGEYNDDEDGDVVTASDKLRTAVSRALIENGAAVLKVSNNGLNNNNNDGNDDDMDSIDLNDLTEEQGKQLDEALSKAFQAMRKSSAEQEKRKKNKTKSQRIQSTTLMHFRIRALDLIDIYVQYKPSLLIILEIMHHLYEMLPYCSVSEDLKPLQQRVEKLLQKITATKNYHNHQYDLKESDLINFIRLILEQKSKLTSLFDFMNHIRNKCIIFLIINSPPLNSTEQLEKSQIIILLKKYLHEFIQSRNPIINTTLVTDIFRLRWLGVWPLAEYLCSSSQLSCQTRTFRRIQIYEVLIELYKNYELHKLNEELMRYYFNKLNTSLQCHITTLGNITLEGELNHSKKEFITLLELFMTINKTYQRLCINYDLKSNEIIHALHSFRIGVQLSTLPAYRRFQQMFNLPQIVFENECTDSFQISRKSDNKVKDAKEKHSNNHGIVIHNSLSINSKRKQEKTQKEMQQIKKLKNQYNEYFSLEAGRNYSENDSNENICQMEITTGLKPDSILNGHECIKMKKVKELKRLAKASKSLNGNVKFSHVINNGTAND